VSLSCRPLSTHPSASLLCLFLYGSVRLCFFFCVHAYAYRCAIACLCVRVYACLACACHRVCEGACDKIDSKTGREIKKEKGQVHVWREREIESLHVLTCMHMIVYGCGGGLWGGGGITVLLFAHVWYVPFFLAANLSVLQIGQTFAYIAGRTSSALSPCRITTRYWRVARSGTMWS
jgi:hypothetical protein